MGGVALATDEVPKIQGASVSRTTTFMKFHNVMYCNLYTLQAVGGNEPSLCAHKFHPHLAARGRETLCCVDIFRLVHPNAHLGFVVCEGLHVCSEKQCDTGQ